MSRAYQITFICLIFLCLFLAGFILFGNIKPGHLLSPLSSQSQTSALVSNKPLQKYAFKSLAEYTPVASRILTPEIIQEEPEFTAHRFTYQTEGKTMTGQLNVPKNAAPPGGYPVVLLLRGFVDPGVYQTGVGTKNAAAAFARNGYVTVSPDFFGYGGSDPPASDVMAERLEKPLNVIDLLASIPSLSYVNPENVFIWAHSNGGQIALSVLEITGKNLPTTLWAPVSKPFPYSILYYTDESDDQGKALRKSLADFETNYDVFDYSIDRYYPQINAPIQIHQGTNDPAVPLEWNTALAQSLDQLGKKVNLFTYPGADHNLQPSWDSAIVRDLSFFKSYTTE